MKRTIGGFKAAIKGLKETLLNEINFRIMAIIALIVVGLMFYFPTARFEKAILIVMIFSVLILELINSAIEKILDFLQPQIDERVRIIKDLMAAIVLIVSTGAIIVGLITFLPYL